MADYAHVTLSRRRNDAGKLVTVRAYPARTRRA
jgi:hypothetical protein